MKIRSPRDAVRLFTCLIVRYLGRARITRTGWF